MENRRKVLWAIDPFDSVATPDAESLKRLRIWLLRTGFQLQPAYVLDVNRANLTPGHLLTQTHVDVKAIKNMLSTYLKDKDLPAVLPPKIFIAHAGSARLAAEALLSHAADYECVVVSSRGRSGLSRLVIGSFAEHLILRSPIPVLTLGHGPSWNAPATKILFATDLSEVSEAMLRQLAPGLKALDARMIILHVVAASDALLNASALSPAGLVPFGEYLEEQASWARERVEDFAKICREAGIEARTVVNEVPGQVAEMILATARENSVSAVVMASQSGSVAATLLGSNARQVVRLSQCPVWIHGPACLERLGIVRKPEKEQLKARSAV